jgi:hypothetical protein
MSTHDLREDVDLVRAALKPRGEEEIWDEVDVRVASERVFDAALNRAEAPTSAKYPPVVQALLDACDAVSLDASGFNMRVVNEGPEALALARAIDHYRAAKAEGFLPAAPACVCRWTVQGYRANVLACRFPHAEREPTVSERRHYPQAADDMFEHARRIVQEATENVIGAPSPEAVAQVAAEWAARAVAAEARIAQAQTVVERFGGIDGEHHKTWVIDQVARALLGDGYAQWVVAMKAGEDGPDTYTWDEGTAP